MADCQYCNKKIDGLPFKCRRCGGYFCSEHRLPEYHDCLLREKNFFKKVKSEKRSKTKFNTNYEIYNPKVRHKRKKGKNSFNVKKFFREYLHFRIPRKIKPSFMQFLLLFMIGFILNYVYYQTISLNYLFIGGINEWFGVLMSFLNNFSGGYDFFYLIINGVYYWFFYTYLIKFLYSTVINLDKKDTWIMIAWFVLIIWIVNRFIFKII